MKCRNRFSERVSVPYVDDEPSVRAKQSMKAECDINSIMRRYIKTGVVAHVNERSGVYGVATSQSYHEAMEIVRHANEMFAAVPAAIRKEFDNDPEKFLRFVSDEKNVEKMRELGLMKPKEAPRVDPLDVLVERIKTAITPAESPGEA